MYVFLVGCLGSRAALAYCAAVASPERLWIMGLLAAVIASGFTLIYGLGLRPTGIETGGLPIWWNSMRPVHAAMYAAFAWSALRNEPEAWRWLAADVVLGFAAWAAHRSLPDAQQLGAPA